MAGKSKAAPSAAGTQCSIIMPFGTYTTASRRAGRAAVLRTAANAGTMPSSSGRASEAPSPRSTVRRGNAFRVRNMGAPQVNRSRTRTLKSENTGAPSSVPASGTTTTAPPGRCTITVRVSGSTTQTSRVPAASQSSTLA